MSPLLYSQHHPLVAVTISYIAGITLSLHFVLPHQFSYFLLLTVGLATVLLIFFKPKIAQPALVVFFIIAGFLNGCLNTGTPESPHHIYTQMDESEETVVIGIVQQLFGFNGQTSKFDVSTSAKRTSDTDLQPVRGTIRYTLKGNLPSTILPGRTFAIRAKLRKPSKYATPGSFDYPEYLARKHIYVTSFIESPLYIQQVHVQQPVRDKIRFVPEVIRAKINIFIDQHLPGDHAAIYKALLTGDRSSISNERIESFKGSGCLHILAISGIHMSLLGLVLYTCFFWLLRRSTWLINRINTKKTAVCLCIIPLLFYTFIAGAKPPVVRSFIMSLVVILAICYGKKHSFASLVSLAALIILIFSPMELTAPSFQLTFVAVISIATALPIIARINTTLKERLKYPLAITTLTWISASLVISAAATVGTAPLIIYHFNLISLIGVAANLCIEPLLCLWSLIIGFFATICIFISSSLAEWFFIIGSKGISLAMLIAEYLHSLPYSSIVLPTVSIFQIILYYLCLFLLIRQHSLKTKFYFSICILFALIIVSFIMPLKELTKRFNRESVITYLDVGHGSCTLIETPGGKRILVDGGALTSPGFDIGQRVITPFLLEKNILNIDDVIVTHPDSDHYNGITSLLRQFKVKNLWVNSKKGYDERWSHFLASASAIDTTIIVPRTNDFITTNDKMSVQVLANTTDATASSADNDSGLIVKYRHGDFNALFPGDISKNMDQMLVETKADLKATILLAAHHGSATSNSIEFLQAVQPETVVVSSGKRSTHFPSSELTKRCSTLNIPFITTNISGTVMIRTEKGGYFIETFYPENTSEQ